MNKFKEKLAQLLENEKNKGKHFVESTSKEREINESIELIMAFYDSDRTLTEPEKQKLLALEEEKIHDITILNLLLCVAKQCIRTGIIDVDTYIKSITPPQIKTSLGNSIGEDFAKAPEKQEQRGIEDER